MRVAGPEFGEGLRIVLIQGLLEEGELEFFERMTKPLCLDRREHHIRIDHEIDLVADGVSYGADPADVLPPVAMRRIDDHFQRLEPRSDLESRGLDELVAVIDRHAESHSGRAIFAFVAADQVSRQFCR